ncbi:MAG: J domain-containing protein, partial [Fimbriimonadales bacterium]|nr:J domain-containing protein [Fimbriimonadales bacterium]
TRLMKAHLNDIWERVETIIREEEAESAARQTAHQELHDAMASSRVDEVPAATSPGKASGTTRATELERAYRVLGVSADADLAAVRRAYRELIARSDPSRFPENTPEREKAEQIRQRIEQAYQTLLLHLDHSAQRFRNLTVD